MTMLTPAADPPEVIKARPNVNITPGAGYLARSTAIVVVAFGVAKAISLLQTVIIASVVGVGGEWDAYVTANRIPEQIFNLIAGGVLGVAFIPIFTGFLAQENRDGAWRLASGVINTAFLVTALASILAFLAAPWLIANVVAPGFDTAAIAETTVLMRILLMTTLIFSISGIVMGILQSFNRFLLPALAPILFDVGILFGVIFLLRPLGTVGIAYGAVLGALLHLGIQIPGLIRQRARWMPLFGWRDPALRRVVRLMIPRMGDIGLISAMGILSNNIASRLGEGAVSAYDWGWRLMQIPETLIGTAMGTVIFPTLAAFSAINDLDGKRAAMSGALRFILVGTIPSAIALILIGQPIISLLERGAFDATATILVYSTLRFFAIGIIVHSLLEVIARAFYADKDTWTPLLVAIGGAAINVVSALLLTGVLTRETPDIGNVGFLALANTLGVGFELGALTLILRKRWRGIMEDALARTAAKTLIASLIMGMVILLIEAAWNGFGLAGRGTLFTILQVGIEGAIGLIVFIVAAYVLRLEELQGFWHSLRNRAHRQKETAA